LDARKATDLLIAQIGLSMGIETASDRHRGLRAATQDLHHALIPQLQKLLSGPHRNEILNRVAKFHLSSSQSGVWKEDPAFPYYASLSGELEIDALEGKIFEKALSWGPLPSRFKLRLEDLELAIPNEKTRAVRVGPDQYELIGKGGRKIRLEQLPYSYGFPDAYLQ